MTSPPSDHNKRLIVSSKFFTWKEVVELIREKRPDLAHRLPSKDAIPPAQTTTDLDVSLTKEVLPELKKYIPWEETVLAGIDEALRLEQ